MIDFLDDSESAIECGPNSAMGKRLAYENLVHQQRENLTDVTLPFSHFSHRIALVTQRKKIIRLHYYW